MVILICQACGDEFETTRVDEYCPECRVFCKTESSRPMRMRTDRVDGSRVRKRKYRREEVTQA